MTVFKGYTKINLPIILLKFTSASPVYYSLLSERFKSLNHAHTDHTPSLFCMTCQGHIKQAAMTEQSPDCRDLLYRRLRPHLMVSVTMETHGNTWKPLCHLMAVRKTLFCTKRSKTCVFCESFLLLHQMGTESVFS